MSRQPRNLLADGVYHVTARGTGHEQVFIDDADRFQFLRLLDQTARRTDLGWLVHCLMGTHYHLLVQARREDLSSGMHRLNGIYAQRFNERHGRTGHLFQSRFSASVIASDAHLENAYRYVVENPVRAGLCAVPDEWPWTGRGNVPLRDLSW